MQRELPLPLPLKQHEVQAVLGGRKTQTRRVLKPRSMEDTALLINMEAGVNVEDSIKELINCSCPYGKPGDLLWVRETWCYDLDNENGYLYKATDTEAQDPHDGGSPWKPSIHMPKEAARIWLEVTDVRVERLQDISEEDAIAEGIELIGGSFDGAPIFRDYLIPSNEYDDGWGHPSNSFASLWRSINGAESWEANPWVWVVSFKVLSVTGKP